jgi:hypothetical protein
MNDINVYQTFEGDNTVLIQQGVKWILDEYKKTEPLDNSTNLNYKVNLEISELVFRLMNAKNKEKCWLDNLQTIISIGIDYTSLYLLNLSSKDTIWKNLFLLYIKQNKINNQILQYLIDKKIFENISQEWDKIHKERTEFIPIIKYPDYLKSLL